MNTLQRLSSGMLTLISFSMTAHASLELFPTQTPNSQSPASATIITPVSNGKSSQQNGSEYYTIPNKEVDIEPSTNQTTPSATPSQVPDIVPFEGFDKLPDRPIDQPSVNKQLPTNKLPPKKWTANTPAINTPSDIQTPANNNTSINTKTNSTSKPTAKEKIIPMAKKVNLKFSDFPVKVYLGKHASPKINQLKSLNSFYGEALKGTKGEKQFIQTLSKAKPNFAGHYVVTSFACGLNCNAAVAYDVKTGEFMELGGGFADCPATDFNPRQKASVTHQANSRLLIVIGSSSSGTCMAGYFEEKNGNVSLINQKNLMNFVDAKQLDYRF